MWLPLYMTVMELRAADQKALLFGAGGVRFALRLSQVREIVPVERDHADVVVRGIPVAAASLSVAFGLTTSRTPLAIVTEGSPFAFRIETVHGVVELASAEVFQLPAHTSLPQPSPFCGAIVTGGAVALELSLHAVGWSPIEPAIDFLPVPDGRASVSPARGRETVPARSPFSRTGSSRRETIDSTSLARVGTRCSRVPEPCASP